MRNGENRQKDADDTKTTTTEGPILGMGPRDAARCFIGWPQAGPAPKASGDHSLEVGS